MSTIFETVSREELEGIIKGTHIRDTDEVSKTALDLMDERDRLAEVHGELVEALGKNAVFITDLIEKIDDEQMACDGPITPTRLVMTDEQLRQIYKAALWLTAIAKAEKQ